MLPLLGLLVRFVPTFLKLFGFVEEAEALIDKYEARKRQQAVANTPETPQERTDAANKGDL